MKRRRMAITAVVTLLGLAGSWCFCSPYYTLWRMRSAARAGELATLATYVDASAITHGWIDVHRQWRSLLDAGSLEPDSSARLLALSHRELAKYDLEQGFRVDQVRSWLADLPIGLADDRSKSCSLHRRGLGRFDYRCGNDGAARLSFRRKGLGWQLDGVSFG